MVCLSVVQTLLLLHTWHITLFCMGHMGTYLYKVIWEIYVRTYFVDKYDNFQYFDTNVFIYLKYIMEKLNPIIQWSSKWIISMALK